MLSKAVRKPKSAVATVEKNRQGSPRYCPFAVKPPIALEGLRGNFQTPVVS